MSYLYWNFPFSERPLQPHYLKSLDYSHSHLIMSYPFPCFYFPLHLPFSCISYIPLVLFTISHSPTLSPSIPLECKFPGGQRYVCLIFCNCNPAPRTVWYMVGTQQYLCNEWYMNGATPMKTTIHSNHLLFTEDILIHYSIHSSKELLRWIILYSFYRWRNWGPERWNACPSSLKQFISFLESREQSITNWRA